MLSSKEKTQAITKKLQKKTGKTIDSWLEILKKNHALNKRKDQAEWLKIKFNLSNDEANIIVKILHDSLQDDDEEDLIARHFQNGKEYLKPVYDKLITSINKWGKLTVTANKSYLSLSNSRQFAILKTTNNGLIIAVAHAAIKAAKSKNFIPVKNFGSNKITHKIMLNDVEDVNEEVLKVLTMAFKKIT